MCVEAYQDLSWLPEQTQQFTRRSGPSRKPSWNCSRFWYVTTTQTNKHGANFKTLHAAMSVITLTHLLPFSMDWVESVSQCYGICVLGGIFIAATDSSQWLAGQIENNSCVSSIPSNSVLSHLMCMHKKQQISTKINKNEFKKENTGLSTRHWSEERGMQIDSMEFESRSPLVHAQKCNHWDPTCTYSWQSL